LSASSHLLGGDPAFGQVKTLIVSYVLNGQRFDKEYREGESFQIGSSKATTTRTSETTTTDTSAIYRREWEEKLTSKRNELYALLKRYVGSGNRKNSGNNAYPHYVHPIDPNTPEKATILSDNK